MASVSPFNVAGPQNVLEKDSRWLSNPYVNENTFLTGFSHLNMSGVGCPGLGVILSMPTTGELKTEHLPKGRSDTNPGIMWIEGGEDIYLRSLRKFTGNKDISVKEVHEVGLSEIKRLKKCQL